MRRRGALIALLAFAACSDDSGIGPAPGRWFDPESIDFGRRVVDHSYTETVTFSNASGRADRILDARFEPDFGAYRARVLLDDGPKTLPNLEMSSSFERPLVIEYKPPDLGVHESELVLVLEQAGSSRLPISGEGVPPLVLNPATLDFGEVELGRDAIRTIPLDNNLPDDVVLQAVLTSRPSFWVSEPGSDAPVDTVIVPAQGRIMVEAHFLPQAIGPDDDQLYFVFDGEDDLVLEVSGIGVEAGRLSCPASHDFGPHPRGDPVARWPAGCTVNGGRYTIEGVTIDSPQDPNSRLELESLPPIGATFADGETFELPFTFTPQGVSQAYAATARIRAAHGEMTDIDVTGEVVAPTFDRTALTANLSWDSEADLDLHLVREGGVVFAPADDCFFDSKNPDWGLSGDLTDDPYLDRDSRSASQGPEEINLSSSIEQSFEVYVHAFNPGMFVATQATVQLYSRGASQGTFIHQFTTCAELWFVGTAYLPQSGAPSFVEANTTTSQIYRGSCR